MARVQSSARRSRIALLQEVAVLDVARDEANAHNRAGLPRPLLKRDGKNTPLPWVAGPGPADGEWAMIDKLRSYEVDADQLCLMCGEPRGKDYVFATVHGHRIDRIFEESSMEDLIENFFSREGAPRSGPTPTWGHPKCILMAASFCPHLKEAQYPAITQGGRQLTHDELRDLAHDKG